MLHGAKKRMHPSLTGTHGVMAPPVWSGENRWDRESGTQVRNPHQASIHPSSRVGRQACPASISSPSWMDLVATSQMVPSRLSGGLYVALHRLLCEPRPEGLGTVLPSGCGGGVRAPDPRNQCPGRPLTGGVLVTVPPVVGESLLPAALPDCPIHREPASGAPPPSPGRRVTPPKPLDRMWPSPHRKWADQNTPQSYHWDETQHGRNLSSPPGRFGGQEETERKNVSPPLRGAAGKQAQSGSLHPTGCNGLRSPILIRRKERMDGPDHAPFAFSANGPSRMADPAPPAVCIRHQLRLTEASRSATVSPRCVSLALPRFPSWDHFSEAGEG